MGKTGSNNIITTWDDDDSVDVITQNVSNTSDIAEESIYLSKYSPTWSIYLKKGSGSNNECRIFAQNTDGVWNLSPSNEYPWGCSCDLGTDEFHWQKIYVNQVSSGKIITNNGTTTDLNNTGIFNMHPRLGNSNDTLTIPIGGIIAVNARGLKEAGLNALNAGNTVQITSTMSVMVAKFKGTSIMEGLYKIGNGQYVLLNDYDAMYDYPNNVDTLVLLLRVV